MNPYPLVGLNHFTVPIGIYVRLSACGSGLLARRGRERGRRPVERGARTILLLVSARDALAPATADHAFAGDGDYPIAPGSATIAGERKKAAPPLAFFVQAASSRRSRTLT